MAAVASNNARSNLGARILQCWRFFSPSVALDWGRSAQLVVIFSLVQLQAKARALQAKSGDRFACISRSIVFPSAFALLPTALARDLYNTIAHFECARLHEYHSKASMVVNDLLQSISLRVQLRPLNWWHLYRPHMGQFRALERFLEYIGSH